jgi:cell division septation protein DedD
MASEDTEITLGVGKLLGLFFLLAAICGVFFSIGYSLGKSSGREQALNDQPAHVNTASDPESADSKTSQGKPSAALAAKADPPAPAAPEANAPDQPSNLTFYKAVQQNDAKTQSAGDSAPPARAIAGPKMVSAAAPAAAASTPAAATGPSRANSDVISHTSPVTGPGTVVVQIAAVSREDDAVALAGALRKKGYNVFVVNNPVTNDKFYHVQVGPFSALSEAEAIKSKLVAEGYNPIIKK